MFTKSRLRSLVPATLVAVAAAVIASGSTPSALAATEPRLGTALNFAVLAGSTVTNTGPTVVTGGLGLDPGSAVTGFLPGVVVGSTEISNAVSLKAKTDLARAFNDAAGATSTLDLSGQDLGGQNLTPGVYTFSSSAQLTGALTLTGNGVYIFQIGSTLTTATASVVNLLGGAQACAVYWEVGSSATLGTGTHFQGNLMAQTDITMVTGADILSGRALAQDGAVTLDSNQISAPTGGCSLPAAPTPTPTASPTATPMATPTASATPNLTPSATPAVPATPTATPPSSTTSVPTLVPVVSAPPASGSPPSTSTSISTPDTGVAGTLGGGAVLMMVAGGLLIAIGRRRARRAR